MLILSAILPVFALIALGYGFGRLRKVGPAGVALLNGYTVWLALPALLFRSLAEGDWKSLDQPGFAAAFGGGMLIAFVIALATAPGALGKPLPFADRALAALAAAYSNTAFIGIPLLEGLIGPVGVTAGVLASILTVSALFALAILLVEIGLNARHGLGGAIGRVAKSVSRNPLFVAPVAGLAWKLVGLPTPVAIDRLLALLAGSASPVALVTIGAFLALPGRSARGMALGHALGVKLVLQPALTAVAALWLLPAIGLPLPREWATAAILLAALPTGTGPFMLAELYGREAGLASRAILVSTILGTATIAVLAALLV